MEVEVSEQDVFIPLVWTDWVYLDLWKRCSWSPKSILPEVEKFNGMATTAETNRKAIPHSWFMAYGGLSDRVSESASGNAGVSQSGAGLPAVGVSAPWKRQATQVSSGKRLSLGFAFLSTYFIHLLYCHIISVANIGYTEWSSSSYTK